MKKLVPIIVSLFVIHGSAEAQPVKQPPTGGTNGAGVINVDPAANSCPDTQAKLDKCTGDLAECDRLKKAAEEDRQVLEEVCGITAGQARDKRQKRSDPPNPPVTDPGPWKSRVEEVPPGHEMCPNGGTVKLTGRDKNRNGKLDDKEISGRAYACKGDPGASGTSGAMTFVVFEPIPAGDATCPDGGVLFKSLRDADGDGKPGAADDVLASAPQCALRGLQGDPGAPAEAAPGTDGNDGADGKDGTSIGIGPMVSTDVISSASEPLTRSSAFGIGLTVEHGDWEWTAAALWSPGIDRGSVFKTDLTYRVWKGLGATAGARLVYAGINERNEANSQFILGDLGVSYQLLDKGHWKARVGAHGSYGFSGSGPDMTLGAKSYGVDGYVAYEF